MDIIKSIFQRKTVVPEKLLAYGFTRNGSSYTHHSVLQDSGFELSVCVTQQGEVSASVTDPTLGEPYTLHLADGAAGSFVGSIRAEYERILQEIALQCFEPDVFKSAQMKRLIAYARDKYGDAPEYLWKKSPCNAVLRRKDTKKWYAVLITLSTGKLGITPAQTAEVIDLRIEPEKMDALIDRERYFPGWHMNKKSWYTMILDGSVPFEELCSRVDESYRLAVK